MAIPDANAARRDCTEDCREYSSHLRRDLRTHFVNLESYLVIVMSVSMTYRPACRTYGKTRVGFSSNLKLGQDP